MLNFSKNILHIILLFSLTIISSEVYANIYHFTLLEKTRKSEAIVEAKCISIQDEKYDLELSKMQEKLKAARFAVYKIMETWKGQYDKETLLLDYKFTNEKYKPFVCRPAVHPTIDEQVILFIEKDFAIFEGFQGKIPIDEKKVPLYQDAITKFLELDTLKDREKVLATIKMVDDDNPYVKESIFRELREIDNTLYGLEIANLLKHKDVSVRRSAINALTRSKDKRIVPLAIAALKDLDSQVRIDATTVLWPIDDEGITPALMQSFNDESAQVRRGVIFALSRRHSKEAIPFYLKALKDSAPLVRAFGANAFEWVQEPKVIPELLNALKDENAGVRESVVRTLYIYIRCGVIKPNNEIINTVALFLADENSRVRGEVAYFIAEAGWKGYGGLLEDDKIIDNLLQIAETDKSYHVRNKAIMALGAIASSRAIPMLLKSLSDTQLEIRAGAANALSKIGDKTALPQLKKALKEEKNEYVKGQLKRAYPGHF